MILSPWWKWIVAIVVIYHGRKRKDYQTIARENKVTE
jgi:hypothetical protein